MKISKWRWSSISVSVQSQLKGTLALLLVGNVVFVIAQVRVLLCWGFGVGDPWDFQDWSVHASGLQKVQGCDLT